MDDLERSIRRVLFDCVGPVNSSDLAYLLFQMLDRIQKLEAAIGEKDE